MQLLDRAVVVPGDPRRDVGPVVTDGPVMLSLVVQPTCVHSITPGVRKLFRAAESKCLVQLRVPERHLSLVPGGVLGVGDVNYEQHCVLTKLLELAALEQHSRELMGPVRWSSWVGGRLLVYW